MNPSSTLRSTSAAVALLATMVSPAHSVEPSKLVSGLAVPVFTKEFNAYAKADKEPQLELRNCSTRAIPNKPALSFACKTVGGGLINGTTQSTGGIQSVEFSMRPTNSTDLDRFRRGAGYLIRATKGETFGAGSLAMSLLSPASQKPGEPQFRVDAGINYMAVREADGQWNFAAEIAR